MRLGGYAARLLAMVDELRICIGRRTNYGSSAHPYIIVLQNNIYINMLVKEDERRRGVRIADYAFYKTVPTDEPMFVKRSILKPSSILLQQWQT